MYAYTEYADPRDPPKTAGSAVSELSPPTEAELVLLAKLRSLQTGDWEAQLRTPPPPAGVLDKIGNPTPLAVAVFGLTNTLMSLVLMHVREVDQLNILVGTMWFVAGLVNIIVSVFELLVGNTFAYTIFGSLGGYFMSLGAMLTPAFGVSAAYGKSAATAAEFSNAMGLFNACWAAMFVLFFIVSIRSNLFMVMIFACVATTCAISAVGDFQAAKGHKHQKHNLDRIAGVFLFISSVPNWYLLWLILTISSGTYVKLPTGDIGIAKKKHDAQMAAAFGKKA
ncbi:hypothetical protein EJ06DRAFT_468531 [Trichodelitschia bisporula]|uniref:Uncharacterized protein n=1 Tax=Trichodelitschia bisporula TaxID=703511 RepID=A0A6G1IBZ5_9PEZI|nr:hypothetical protein EJ06DRAFT_468531 [Trichodelitschia bisporula]